MDCACKGIRTCLICETREDAKKLQNTTNGQLYYFCPSTNLISKQLCDHKPSQLCSIPPTEGFPFEGVQIFNDFISISEEEELLANIDATPWVDSQSGRRKQDYGPKVNFKRKKVQTSCFSGFPGYIEPIVNRLKEQSSLAGFSLVEMCCLEYTSLRGSAIDPHKDDAWLWGPRLVTLNLSSHSCLTLSLGETEDQLPWKHLASSSGSVAQVKIPMRRRSVLVLDGPARYIWMHAINREDICEGNGRRVCVTFRELTPEFLTGGEREEIGSDLLQRAESFSGLSVAQLNTKSEAET